MACGYGLSLPLLEHEYQLNIHFSTLTDRGDIFFTGFGLYPDGSIDYDAEAEHGRNSTSPEDELFLEKMRSLVLQTLLVLQFEPNVLHTPSMSSFTRSGKGFGVKSNISGDSFLFPRMLKIEKQRKKYLQLKLGLVFISHLQLTTDLVTGGVYTEEKKDSVLLGFVPRSLILSFK